MIGRHGVGAVLMLCVAVAFDSMAHAQNYRAEIMQYVIDPCVMATARHRAAGNVTARQMAELIKLTNREQYDG